MEILFQVHVFIDIRLGIKSGTNRRSIGTCFAFELQEVFVGFPDVELLTFHDLGLDTESLQSVFGWACSDSGGVGLLVRKPLLKEMVSGGEALLLAVATDGADAPGFQDSLMRAVFFGGLLFVSVRRDGAVGRLQVFVDRDLLRVLFQQLADVPHSKRVFRAERVLRIE